MGLTENLYFADFFAGDGVLNGRTPDIGGIWSGSGSTSGGHTVALSQGTSAQSATNAKYVEQVIRFNKTDDVETTVQFGKKPSAGYLATWNLRAAPNQDTITLFISSGFQIHIDIGNSGPGVHEIRIVGEGSVLTAYFNGEGLRITDIPDDSSQDYDGIGFTSGINIEVEELYAYDGIPPDFLLTFDTNFGGVGGSSGSGGGGGGSGGSPSSGGSNPSDVPCDPDTTLVINNGQVVSVAPTDPCQWVGMIWWKLACEETLTSADYAVEAEVFFNTLTDPFMSVGVIARLIETTGGFYFASLWNDEIVIGKKPSAAADPIILDFKLLTLTAGRWYKIRLEVEGFMLRAYLDDTLELTTADVNMSFADPGCAGIQLSRSNTSTDIRFDNFRVWLNVKRPIFAELPLFAESISILKDDGDAVNFSVSIADSWNASESFELDTPKTVHINEGAIFTDLPSQVKQIQEFMRSLDTFDLGHGIFVDDFLRAAETYGLRMSIPITDVFTFTDEDRAVHGVSDTMTVAEFLSQLVTTGALDAARASDSVQITKTSVADFARPEVTFYARDIKRVVIVENGKKVE